MDVLVASFLAKPDHPNVCGELVKQVSTLNISAIDISAVLAQLSPQNQTNAYVALLYVWIRIAMISPSVTTVIVCFV